MSAKPNPTAIGLFIVAGLALGVAGIITFSSARFFTRTQKFILYFEGSLNGLSEGAPVKLRGVTIGAVKKVMINFDQATNDYTMPVIIEIREDLMKERIASVWKMESVRDVEANIKRGLRATLGLESLVTGVLYVDLDTSPNAPPPVYHQLGAAYVEIPTQPTQTQQLLNNIASVDLKGLENKISALIATLEGKARAVKAEEISTGLTNLLASLDQLVHSRDLTNAVASVGTTLERYRALADKVDSRIGPIADGITNSLAQVDLTLAELRGAAEDVRGLLEPGAALRSDLSQALSRLSTAAQSVADLADFLQRHPNALISGRKAETKTP
jgi:paraquat-inducible protein B